MKTVGIIPARGGSKGLPGKHLLDLWGRPLLDWTLKAASESKRLSFSVLSSDDPKLYLRADGFKRVQGWARPADLARDDTPTEAVMEHVIDRFVHANHPIDTIVLLQPTSPLRTGRHIDEAIDLLERTGADSVVAVVPSHAFHWTGNRPMYDPACRPRRQDMGGTFEECGAIYVTTMRQWERTHTRLGGHVELYVMGPEHLHQVDAQVDLDLLNALLASRARPVR